MPKNPRLGKNSISFHFSHIGFDEKTYCKLSVSNGSANCLRTYKMKDIFLLVGVGRWDLAFLDFEIWHFSITFLGKKGRFICFQKEKWNFTTFSPPWKDLCGYFWKKTLIASTSILPTPLFLITVDVGADFSRSSWMISNLLQNRVEGNIRW